MSAPDWQRVRTLYHILLEHPPHEHQRLLEQHCGYDPVLCAEVNSLLAADAAAGDFLHLPPTLDVGRLLAAARPHGPSRRH